MDISTNIQKKFDFDSRHASWDQEEHLIKKKNRGEKALGIVS
jgi:hypothetical protein